MKAITFYRNTYFNRLILSYTALAVVLLGLAGGYLYTQANRMMVDEIARESQNRLDTVKSYMEGTLLRKYEDNLRSKAISTVFIQDSSSLNVLLDGDWEGNLSRIASFRQDLDRIRQVLEGASDVTVYFRQGNYVVNSSQFYMNPEHAVDSDYIKALPQAALNRWTVRSLPDGTRAMTYAVKLPYGTLAAPKGYMYIDVDLDYLRQAAANVISSSNERLFVFDRAGDPVLGTADANEREKAHLLDAARSGRSVTTFRDADRGNAVLAYLDGSRSEDGFAYALLRPMNSFVLVSRQLQTKIFLGCGLVLLLGLAMSYLFSQRFNTPMKKLVQSIRGRYQPGFAAGPANEYAIIGRTLHLMDEKIASLETQAKTSEMRSLLLGASLGLEQLDAMPKDGRYQTAHIRLLEGDSEKFRERFEELELPLICEAVVLNPQEAALVFFLDPAQKAGDEAIAAALARVREETRDELRFGAGIGASAEAPEELPLSYRAAVQAYRYRFLFGTETIVSHEKVAAFDPQPYLFPLEPFKNALRSGDAEAANRFLDRFEAELRERSPQLETVELALLQLASALYETVIKLELQQLVPPSDLFDEAKKETLAETIQAIRELSGQIAAHARESGSHSHADVIYKLKAYIDGNLHEDLTLQVLSEVASLAPAYISTLFREVMNETFIEYVTRTRLDRAAALLREEERMSVADIAARVGYRNPQYFHAKFKARFGVTPTQYRNLRDPDAASAPLN